MAGWAEAAQTAGKVAGGAGTAGSGIAGLYGTHQQVLLNQKLYEQDRKRYEDELNRMRMLDALSQRQMNLGNLGTYGELAQGQADRLQNIYGKYNRMIQK